MVIALGDWRGTMLDRVRALLQEGVLEVIGAWEWRSVRVWLHGGILCTGNKCLAAAKSKPEPSRRPRARTS